MGTHLDPALEVCVPDHVPAVCNPETTVEVLGDDDVILCKGDCSGGCPPACPLPAVGHVTVCGQLVDFENSTRVTVEGGGTGIRCDEIPVAERTGPCAMEVTISDGLEWPIPPDPIEVSVYDCGYYAVKNIPSPSSGRFLITVDDAPDSGREDWATTAITFRVVAGERRESVNTYALRRDTDEAWTVSAGEPFGGLTFSEKGALALIFLRAGSPASNVRILRSPEGAAPDDDYYFSDNARDLRTTIDTYLEVTGLNGTGLIVDSDLVDHSGMGGLPDPCVWPWEPAGSFPGLVLVSERSAELFGGGACE